MIVNTDLAAESTKVAMPRGSRPGERRGGRQRGTPNKKTVLKEAAIRAAGVDPNSSPLDFLLGLMRDPKLPLDLRVDFAKTAAPYLHTKLKEPARDAATAIKDYGAPPPQVNKMGLTAAAAETKGVTETTAVAGATVATGATALTATAVVAGAQVISAASQSPLAYRDDPKISPLDFLLGVMHDPEAAPGPRFRAARAAARYVHARRDRPEEPPIVVDDPYGFTFNMTQARALREDRRRMNQMPRDQTAEAEWEKYEKQYKSDEITLDEFFEKTLKHPPPESKELREARERVEERIKALPDCPATYTQREANRDEWRLQKLEKQRRTKPYKLSREEDAEEAHLMTRLATFQEGAEYRGRARIIKLTSWRFGAPLSEAEEIELKDLRERYPELPLDPEDPQYRRKMADREREVELENWPTRTIRRSDKQ
jgi:hypothetical protein